MADWGWCDDDDVGAPMLRKPEPPMPRALDRQWGSGSSVQAVRMPKSGGRIRRVVFKAVARSVEKNTRRKFGRDLKALKLKKIYALSAHDRFLKGPTNALQQKLEHQLEHV